jgi:hypothetical protein
MQCFRVDVAPIRPQTIPRRLYRFSPGAECKSVMVAERLNCTMMANLARLRLALCTKLPVFCTPARCERKPQMHPSPGRVIDPSKATIADAKVSAVNLGTNFRYEMATMARANTRCRICRQVRTASKWKSRDSRNSFGRS